MTCPKLCVSSYLGWLGRRLRLKSGDAWLKLTAKQLRDNHGNRILAKMSVKGVRSLGASLIAPATQKVN